MQNHDLTYLVLAFTSLSLVDEAVEIIVFLRHGKIVVQTQLAKNPQTTPFPLLSHVLAAPPRAALPKRLFSPCLRSRAFPPRRHPRAAPGHRVQKAQAGKDHARHARGGPGVPQGRLARGMLPEHGAFKARCSFLLRGCFFSRIYVLCFGHFLIFYAYLWYGGFLR